MKRFELSTSPWQGDALPLSYIRMVTGLMPVDLLSMHHRGPLGQAPPPKKEMHGKREG